MSWQSSRGKEMSESKKALFSVIVPVFNRAGMVEEALDSVFEQTYRPIELVIVDDGSTDDTAKAIENWAHIKRSKDFIVRYIYQDNQRVCTARNTGIKNTTGDYVQFLDSDDWLKPKRLERLTKFMRETGADFVTTGFDGFDPDENTIVEQRPANVHRNLVEQALAGRFWGNSLRCAYSRELVERTGPWDTEFLCFEDREYSERALFLSENPRAIEEILATARRHKSERLSSLLTTKVGRGLRIEAEARLLELAKTRNDIPNRSYAEFASRLFGLGVRSYASGWIQHGRRCGKIAKAAIGCAPTEPIPKKGRMLAWNLGVLGGLVYGGLGLVKNKLTR
jgi:glycosyltransferase involved in cell wall biosynthesis